MIKRLDAVLKKIKPATRPDGRVKVPTVLQMEAVECGPASLAMIMAHYGLYVPLEELRIACGVSRNGSKASNILKAARDYGFDAKGYKKDLEPLKNTDMPVIVFWNFNHFLVVEGFRKGKVYLNDPASGPRIVTEEEFDESFTGVTLVIRPGPDFTRGGEKRSLLRSLGTRMGSDGRGLLYVLLVSLLLVLVGLVVPSFTRIFVDYYLVQRVENWLWPMFGVMAATALLQAGLTWLQQNYLLRLETKLAVASSARFFWHVLRLPIEFFVQRYAADISVRVALNDRVAQLLSGDLATNLLNVLLIAFYVIVMLQYDVVLTILGVVIALLNIVALRFISRKRVDANQRSLNDQSKLMATAFSGLRMVENLKATGSESDFFSRWSGHQAKAIRADQELGLLTEALAVIPPVLSALNVAVILTAGGLRIMNGQLTIGGLVAFQALMASFLAPVNQVVNLGSRLQQTEGDLVRLDDVLRYPIDSNTEQRHTGQDTSGGKLTGRVELRNVTFGYSKLEPPLIENLSLTLEPGSRVALVGGTGSGKSTVAKLVAGLYDPWSGEILFDGQTRDQIPRTKLNNSLAMVDQDIFLFEGTVRENLTMWDSTIPETNIGLAARDAAIHEEVAARPGGYDSPVSEGGTNFSGGQRQRLEIARALVTNPTILIMDEATSALDPITEKIIDDNLRRRGCTCLIVAHRLSTIRDCDEIIVLDRGKVVQRGTHKQLMRSRGRYAQLIQAGGAASKTESLLDLL
ncbi:MAG: NHLP family bacteriocin export ABC transporter peptidase/permease/ATPase subunit [Chloroflexi bacterium]|nr:NHLP family bacteriocin export ABC transporter peptidase/permease/ATPase subunit [Chloroflexota bacterium]